VCDIGHHISVGGARGRHFPDLGGAGPRSTRSAAGRGLAPEDNRLLFESVARLNAADPSQVGRSDVTI
jgi:hypothetical protein